MLFCNLTPLDGRFVNAIVFCRIFEFCEYITPLHIQHSIYVRQFEFFVFTMKQIASIFCNVSFAGQYINSFIFISNFHQQASCCDIYPFMVLTMKKSGKLQLETVFCFLLWLRNAVTYFVFK